MKSYTNVSKLTNGTTLSGIPQELQSVWNYDWPSRPDSVTDLFLKFRHLISGVDFIIQCYRRIWKSKQKGSKELHAEQETVLFSWEVVATSWILHSSLQAILLSTAREDLLSIQIPKLF